MPAKKTEETQEATPVRAPAIGDLVHFVHGTAHVPAFITAPAITVIDARTNAPVERTALTVLPISMPPFTDMANYDADGAPGTWHWPEAVSAEAESTKGE